MPKVGERRRREGTKYFETWVRCGKCGKKRWSSTGGIIDPSNQVCQECSRKVAGKKAAQRFGTGEWAL